MTKNDNTPKKEKSPSSSRRIAERRIGSPTTKHGGTAEALQYIYLLNTLKEEISILQNIGDEYLMKLEKYMKPIQKLQLGKA